MYSSGYGGDYVSRGSDVCFILMIIWLELLCLLLITIFTFYFLEIFRLVVALIHQPIPVVAWVVVVIWVVVVLDLITKVCRMFKAVLFDRFFHSYELRILLHDHSFSVGKGELESLYLCFFIRAAVEDEEHSVTTSLFMVQI